MADIQDFQTDHLIILVGTNPLPNYVAARLLLRDEGKLHLVYTDDTGEIARRLAKHLAVENRSEFYRVESSRPSVIETEIKKAAANASAGRVGLHYTGGTKAMSVHAHRVLREERPDGVFSYLDGGTLKMCIDKPENQIFVGLNPKSKIGIGQLLELHAEPLEKFKTTPMLPDLACVLTQVAQDADKWRVWEAWLSQFLGIVKPKGRYPKTDRQLQKRNHQIPWPGEPLDELCEAMQETFGQTEEAELSINKATEVGGFEKVRHFCEWITGKWLEAFVLQAVRDCADQVNIHEFATSVQVKNRASRDFEFDVIAMRGYQLLGISCTTDTSNSLCKSKLFEADIRARQLGGDEAKAALVCHCPKPKELKEEIFKAWGAKDEEEQKRFRNRVNVFGPEHLDNLSEELAKWFTAI